MRAFTAVIAVTLVAGCGKGKKSDDSTPTGNTGTTPDLEFADSVSGTAVFGHVASDTITAHKSANLVLGAVGLAFADASVQSKMSEHSTGARSNHCWNGPLFPQSTFTLDYTPCENDGIQGGMIFNDDPLGPVGMDFKALTLNEVRSINGAMGFDAAGANPLHWTLYDTRGTEPIIANRQPFDVEVDGREGSITFDGGAFMRGLNQNTAVWGVLSFTPYGGNPTEILIGSTDSSELVGWSEPAEPASMTWSYLTCRCPTTGLIAMDVSFDIEEVTFDLDDLLVGDDGVDDPEVDVPVSTSISGPAEARAVDCGEWEVTYSGTDSVQVDLSSTELKDAIQNLCDTAVITDTKRCTALLLAADGVASVSVEVGPNRLGTAVADEASVEFDTSYCRP